MSVAVPGSYPGPQDQMDRLCWSSEKEGMTHSLTVHTEEGGKNAVGGEKKTFTITGVSLGSTFIVWCVVFKVW